MVEAVSLSIVVAARQNIALRGHRNERLDRSNLSMISINGNKEKIIKGDKNAGNLNSLFTFPVSLLDVRTCSTLRINHLHSPALNLRMKSLLVWRTM